MTDSRRVAVVGAGPAGRAAARELVTAGAAVTIYDREPQSGGLMRYGYPSFRMPDAISIREAEQLKQLGVTLKLRQELGKDVTLEQLLDGYEAVLLAIGSPVARRLGIPGENLPRVYTALEYLHASREDSPLTTGETVLVIGGGDTAIDAATTAVALGATDVTIAYRGPEAGLKAQPHEITYATERGVHFECNRTPAMFQENAKRLKTVFQEGGELLADAVIIAIGQDRNSAFLASLGLIVRQDGSTDNPRVFVAGDTRYGSNRLAAAILDGRRAAKQILGLLE